MAKLAILGHATRGKEVIEILEMLGGNNPRDYVADSDCFGYFIGNETRNIYYDWLYNFEGRDVIIFTLEEFLERFPYKVGDKVKNTRINDFVGRIINVRWDNNEEEVIYYVEWDDETKSTLPYFAKGLQPYKEETIEGKITINEDKGTLVSIDLTREFKKANEIEVILGDYEFELKDGKTYFVKKKNKYPKTYKECCDVLGLDTMDNDAQGYKAVSIIRFQELLIARDAYWKIAGEQMELGKSWEPDWTNNYQKKWIINFYQGEINLTSGPNVHFVFAFPTEEMRDAFYEYFKDLIEECKEFL